MEFKKIQLNGFKSFAEKTNFLIDVDFCKDTEMTKTGMCILAEGISFCGSPSFCTVWNVQTSIGSLGIIWYGNDE